MRKGAKRSVGYVTIIYDAIDRLNLIRPTLYIQMYFVPQNHMVELRTLIIFAKRKVMKPTAEGALLIS